MDTCLRRYHREGGGFFCPKSSQTVPNSQCFPLVTQIMVNEGLTFGTWLAELCFSRQTLKGQPDETHYVKARFLLHVFWWWHGLGHCR